MKKSKNTLLAALAFSAAINLNGCVYGPPYDPSDNVLQGAYGPPPSGYLESAPDETSQDNISYTEAQPTSEDNNGTDDTN